MISKSLWAAGISSAVIAMLGAAPSAGAAPD